MYHNFSLFLNSFVFSGKACDLYGTENGEKKYFFLKKRLFFKNESNEFKIKKNFVSFSGHREKPFSFSFTQLR